MTLRVLSVASEAFPLVKTGGLADVVGALPAALASHNISVTTLIPAYPNALKAAGRTKVVHQWDDLLGHAARLHSGKLDGHPLLLLDIPALFTRDGGPYSDKGGKDWGDNGRRFAALSAAAAQIGTGVMGKPYDVVHAHDWQAGLTPAYLRYSAAASKPKSVITIHNIAFQGRFDAALFSQLGLPPEAWSVDGIEYYGGVGYLKAGLACADAITTVSPTYAREIREREFGMGLEGLIAARARDVHGILNGIDRHIWNPATDQVLLANYASPSSKARRANKRAVERAFGLTRSDGPLFIVVSRLTWQKGMDLLIDALEALVGAGGRLAVLGAGDVVLENAFHGAAARHPGRIAIRTTYDEPLSHLMQGGGDAILIPSRFEPCGLTQLYALAYGCVPIVARTGGLADTVIDANEAARAAGVATGLQFDLSKPEAMVQVLARATALFANTHEWRRLQANGMKADFSWDASGARYAALYRSLLTA